LVEARSFPLAICQGLAAIVAVLVILEFIKLPRMADNISGGN